MIQITDDLSTDTQYLKLLGTGVPAGYKTKRLSITFTGTGATSQYDAVGTLTEIANWATANGRGATLRRAWIECNNNAIAPQFEIHFFNASNPTVAADNETWTSLAAEAYDLAKDVNSEGFNKWTITYTGGVIAP